MASYLLSESGGKLLQENGDAILVDETLSSFLLQENGDRILQENGSAILIDVGDAFDFEITLVVSFDSQFDDGNLGSNRYRR